MRGQLGMALTEPTARRKGSAIPAMSAGDIYRMDFHLQLPELYPSSFSFSPAIADGTLHGYTTCDWIDNAIVLQMSPTDGEIYGHLHLPCRVELNQCIAQPAVALSHAEPKVG